jgi:hypothetical protein
MAENRPWEINCECALLIPDIHQDIEWAQEVLRREDGQYDRVVFLGDIADSHRPQSQIAGIRATARFYRELIERSDSTVLLGNHCAPLMESWKDNRQFKKKIPLLHGCSGYTNGKSIEFNKEMTWDHWRKVRLFSLVNGWLLSHAGLNKAFWWHHRPAEQNLVRLWLAAEEALTLLPYQMHPFFECGKARRGPAPYGGVLWQDWDCEFTDDLSLPQIVGHTPRENVRQKGRSYCIDTGQKSYALIRWDGSVEFKAVVRTAMSGTWVEEPVVVESQND